MNEPTKNGEWSVSGTLAVMVTIMVAIAALAPYALTIPESNLNLITQAQTTLWNGWLLILGFYFGTTQSQGRKDATISTLADTAKASQAALAPIPSATTTATNALDIAPGEVATVTATETPKP